MSAVRWLLALIILTFSSNIFAQKKNTALKDSLAKIDASDTTKKHSVLKAAILSACLPGAGQIYNSIAMPKGHRKAYWKVPLIYAGLGATGYFIFRENKLQQSLKKEYLFRASTNFTQVSDQRWAPYDAQALIQMREQHQNQRDLFIIGFGLVYLLQVADAAVEAHFVHFDISEDLSLQIRPTYLNLPTQPVNGGIRIALNF